MCSSDLGVPLDRFLNFSFPSYGRFCEGDPQNGHIWGFPNRYRVSQKKPSFSKYGYGGYDVSILLVYYLILVVS